MAAVVWTFELRRPPDGEDWSLSEESAPLGSRGARSPLDEARVAIALEGAPVAIAEARAMAVVWLSPSGGDHDLVLALRLVERCPHPVWSALPWRDLPVGSVFYLWDHWMNARSRGSSDPDLQFSLCTWEELEAGWASRNHTTIY